MFGRTAASTCVVVVVVVVVATVVVVAAAWMVLATFLARLFLSRSSHLLHVSGIDVIAFNFLSGTLALLRDR